MGIGALIASLTTVVERESKRYFDDSLERSLPVIVLDKSYDIQTFGIGNKYNLIHDFADEIKKTKETSYRIHAPTEIFMPTFHTYDYMAREQRWRDKVPKLKCEIPESQPWFHRGGGGFDGEEAIALTQPLQCKAEDVQLILLLNCDLQHHFEKKDGGVLCVIKQDEVRYFEWLQGKLVEIHL